MRGRILLVEDDPEAAHYFCHVLTRRGQFYVAHTASPTVALALAVTEHWDLVLTDLDLPVMSGLELLDGLRRIAPEVPVILVTAHALNAGRPLAAGGDRADVILAKPVPADRLLATTVALTDRANPRTWNR